jgi:hypothetical protein
VHPMIIAGASWLPFILAMVELVVQQRPALGRRPATLPWALLGALGLGCQMLAGHAENTYFVLLVTGAYALWRLISQSANRQVGKKRLAGWLLGWFVGSTRSLVWLTLMLVLGLGLGAVQFVPLVQVATTSFRGGAAAASLQQVLGWAYPWRRLITFGVPNFFGNPAHHGYLDLFTWRWAPALTFPDGQYIDWGIKNYVEGGVYLGLLPLFLATIAVLQWLKPHISRITYYVLRITHHASRFTFHVSRFTFPSIPSTRYSVPFFALLALFSLGCIFGTPLYALVYALPVIEQSHSPFRWVFPLTLSVAILAGFGVEAVRGSREQEAGSRKQEAGGRKQEAGGRRQEAGGRRQEAGGRRQEAGDRRQEAGGGKQERGRNLQSPISNLQSPFSNLYSPISFYSTPPSPWSLCLLRWPSGAG